MCLEFCRLRLFLILIACLTLASRGDQLTAAEEADSVTEALQLTVSRRIGDARKWLDEGDFKSLAQTAGGLRTLGSLVQARSDDEPWQAASGGLVAAVGDLESAARGEDAERAVAALAKLDATAAALKTKQPTGKPLAAPRVGGSLRSIMLVMEGVRGDTKIDLLTGNTEDAKKGAYVLSELGRVVSNSRSGSARGEEWTELSSAFIQASLAAARSPATDAASVRQLLRGVSQRCDACHETRN
jgi:cytochrome c556